MVHVHDHFVAVSTWSQCEPSLGLEAFHEPAMPEGGCVGRGKAVLKSPQPKRRHDGRAILNLAKRLKCVRSIGAFAPARIQPWFMVPRRVLKIVGALHEPPCSVSTLEGVGMLQHAKAWTPNAAIRFMVARRDSGIVEALSMNRTPPEARSPTTSGARDGSDREFVLARSPRVVLPNTGGPASAAG